MIPTKSVFVLCAAVLGLAIPQAQATQISFAGGSSTSGTFGNTRSFSSGGVTVTAWAQSLIGGVGGEDSYVGVYSGGLGVTNSNEGAGWLWTHTADNLGSDDRVIFSFSSPVILDTVGLYHRSNRCDPVGDFWGANPTVAGVLDDPPQFVEDYGKRTVYVRITKARTRSPAIWRRKEAGSCSKADTFLRRSI